MNGNKRQIWSENACNLIAADLYEQAARWEKRAQEIKNYRGNIKPVQDPAPAMKAALRVLVAMQNGMDPKQECTRVCRQYYLQFEQVWQLYRSKLAAHEREQIAKRNRAIHKMALTMKPIRIAERVGLSKGQVSKILNKKTVMN